MTPRLLLSFENNHKPNSRFVFTKPRSIRYQHLFVSSVEYELVRTSRGLCTYEPMPYVANAACRRVIRLVLLRFIHPQHFRVIVVIPTSPQESSKSILHGGSYQINYLPLPGK